MTCTSTGKESRACERGTWQRFTQITYRHPVKQVSESGCDLCLVEDYLMHKLHTEANVGLLHSGSRKHVQSPGSWHEGAIAPSINARVTTGSDTP